MTFLETLLGVRKKEDKNVKEEIKVAEVDFDLKGKDALVANLRKLKTTYPEMDGLLEFVANLAEKEYEDGQEISSYDWYLDFVFDVMGKKRINNFSTVSSDDE